MKVFRWHPVELFRHYSREELRALQRALEQDPKNRNPEYVNGRSLFIYSEKAGRKLNAVGWALNYHEWRRRAEAGEVEGDAGWWSL